MIMARQIQIVGRTIDKQGRPVVGVGMALAHVRGAERRLFGNTVSGPNGAFVLSARFEEKLETGFKLELSTNEKALDADAILAVPQDKSVWGPHVFVVERAPQGGTIAPRNALLAGGDELIDIWKADSSLFSRPVPARTYDPCSPYAPNDAPSQVFQFSQLVPLRSTTMSDDQDGGRDVADLHQARPRFGASGSLTAVDFVNGGTDVTHPRWAFVLELTQEWFRLGQSLGDLLYSLPLAPCEQVKLAAVDWRRRETARQQNGVDEKHDQDTTVERNQSVAETVRMLSDKQTTGSVEGGGVGATVGPFSGGYSKTVTSAGDAVDASTESARQVADRTHQVSSTVRSTRAFAIAEVTQEEEARVSTRVVRNHNHCHTLTFQYYEVLDHWLVRTRPRRLRPALLVPFAALGFDASAVARYGYEIRRALLDPTLAGVLDRYLEGAGSMQGGAELPDIGQTPPGPDTQVISSFRLAASGLEPALSIVGTQVWLVVNDEPLMQSSTPIVASSVADEGREEIDFRAPTGLRVDAIRRLGLLYAASPRVGLDPTVPDATFTGVSVAIQPSGGVDWTEIAWVDRVDAPTNQRVALIPSRGTEWGSIAPDTSSVPARLLQHLIAHRFYYTAQIIRSGDPAQRFRTLHGLGISEIVDNTIVGQLGNLLAFPLVSSDDLPDALRTGMPQDGKLTGGVEERLVALPTPGVFMETQMGQCSACEVIDDTRFWNWQTSPCPDEAPNITPEMLASRYQSPAPLLQITKSDLEPKDVQIPELPEPMIKIGDATLAELVKGLDLPDAAATLAFLEGVAKIGSDHSLEVFKTIWSAYTGKAGGPGTGGTKTGEKSTADTAPTQAPAGNGGIDPGTTVTV
jgi:hypothetical protein